MMFKRHLTISIFCICNVNQGNFNSQEGKGSC